MEETKKTYEAIQNLIIVVMEAILKLPRKPVMLPPAQGSIPAHTPLGLEPYDVDALTGLDRIPAPSPQTQSHPLTLTKTHHQPQAQPTPFLTIPNSYTTIQTRKNQQP